MNYHNILFPNGKAQDRVPEELLYDLRIDTVLMKLANGPDQLKYDTCYLPLRDKESVLYRHAIFQDIMRGELYSALMQFQDMMNTIHLLEDRMSRIPISVMRQRYLLESILYYVKTIEHLFDILKITRLKSEGLKFFLDDLSEYIDSDEYNNLREEVLGLEAELASMLYQIHVKDNHVLLRRLEEDPVVKERGIPSSDTGKSVEKEPNLTAFDTGKSDREESNKAAVVDDRETRTVEEGAGRPIHFKTALEAELEAFFGQFIYGKASFPNKVSDSWDLNPVEEQILNAVTRLYPEPFHRLADLAKKKKGFVPAELTTYHQDLGFYTVWLAYIVPRQAQGLNFCFPMIADREQGFMASNAFDLILADQMLKEEKQVIRNNLILQPGEDIMVLTGPNQGGKTTFARMLGQLFYLGSLGIPVPGTTVRMFLPDHIYTHFERQEMQSSLSGKLKDDIVRIHDILDHATNQSLILINEMFASTTLQDAAWLGKKILDQIRELGALCLYVTFITELSSYLPGTVSLISGIEENQEERTYQIIRAQSDGKAYALSMARAYSLTYEDIIGRIGQDDKE